MKIVHLIEYFSPALGYQETYLALEQQRAGHQVTVVTSDRYFPFPNYDSTVRSILGERIVGARRSKEFGLDVIRLPVAVEIFTRVWIKDLMPTLKSLNPDVIHLHSVSSLSTLRLALSRQFAGTTLLADDHSHLSVVAGNPVKDLFYGLYRTLFGRIVSQNIDHFVAITPETKSIVREYMGITAKVSVIELGADTNVFKSDHAGRKKNRNKFGFSNKDVAFIYTGKLIAEKGIDILICAFLELPKTYKLILVGSGPSEYLDPLKAELAGKHKEKDVIWIPFVKPVELPALYATADVGVWPKQESISMLEAAACGLPVIVKKSPSMAKRVARGNGLLYEEGNVAKLRSAMLALGSNKARRSKMGALGRELIEAKYSWEALANQFVTLYRKKRL